MKQTRARVLAEKIAELVKKHEAEGGEPLAFVVAVADVTTMATGDRFDLAIKCNAPGDIALALLEVATTTVRGDLERAPAGDA